MHDLDEQRRGAHDHVRVHAEHDLVSSSLLQRGHERGLVLLVRQREHDLRGRREERSELIDQDERFLGGTDDRGARRAAVDDAARQADPDDVVVDDVETAPGRDQRLAGSGRPRHRGDVDTTSGPCSHVLRHRPRGVEQRRSGREDRIAEHEDPVRARAAHRATGTVPHPSSIAAGEGRGLRAP